MERKEVKFTIAKGGGIRMEHLTGQGDSCVEDTKELEISLSNAGKKTDSGKKPEYYEGGNGINVFNDLK